MEIYPKKRYAKYALTGAILGVFLLLFAALIGILSKNNQAPDKHLDYMKGVIWAIFILIIVFFVPWSDKLRGQMIILWLTKISVTLFFMLFYEYKYSALDAYLYYRIGMKGVALTGSFFENSGTIMVGWIAHQFNNILPFIDSYHALKVLWSFFGLLGSYFFFLAYTEYTQKKVPYLLMILGIFPSILFWSSILGKDPITFLGISLLFYSCLGLLKRFQIKYLVGILIGVFFLALIRVWLIGIFLIPFTVVFVFRSKINKFLKVVFLSLVLLVISYNLKNLPLFLQFETKDQFLETSQAISRSWSYGGSGQAVDSFHSIGDMIKFLPKGAFSALFRPMPGEIMNAFGLMAGLENVFLLGFLIFGFFKARKGILKDPFVQMVLLTLVLWSSAYGFVSMQNFGTAVRFKLQVIPFLILLGHYLLSSSKEPESS